MNPRDVLIGAGLVLWLQWTTSRRKVRDAADERIRRGHIKAWLIIRLRANEQAAAWIAARVPRAWL